MKRFIRYLYEYEQGKQTRNVGFIKVESDQHECMIHIHGKGLRLGADEKLKLYLFYREGEECVGIWQGDIENINPAMNYRLHFTEEDVGMPENFPKINGVILSDGQAHRFASVWDDVSVDIDGMREWTKEISEALEIQDSEEAEVCGEPEEETPEEADVQVAEEIEALTEEAPDIFAEAQREAAPEEKMRKPWRVTKIQRKELAKLPRCEWRLANNNFLLHGYYNYRHLVFIENKQMMHLGVPGIFHEKEQKVAETFGFPEFIPAEELKVSLSPEECGTEEQFGYWCRQVRHPFY